MRKIALLIFIVTFTIGTAFTNSMMQKGYYLWDANTLHYTKYYMPPEQEVIEMTCWGASLDCYYIMDETGTIKSCIEFRDF